MIKTASVRNGKKSKGYAGLAEYFGVYSPDTGKVYMIAVADASKSNMTLRLVGNDHVYAGTKVNWAKDFEI